MFFFTYLRGELHCRTWQALFIALGLALGVGLVVTVAAASSGVDMAQSGVLTALYGVGTDLTVTGPALTTPGQSCVPTSKGQRCGANPSSASPSKSAPTVTPGHTYDVLVTPYQEPISASAVTAVTRLHDVAATAGVLTLVDSAITYPANGGLPHVAAFTVDGVGTRHTSVGPLSAASVSSGRFFTAADADADVAVVDSGYATSSNLKVDSTITIVHVRFTVIGIVSQPQGTSPPDVYIPLARAQALATVTKHLGGSVGNRVNLIYVAAASAADIPALQREISRLLPGDIVTASTSLASEVTGSLSSAAKLANDLGRWVSVLALIAALALACLLTLGAVARRSAEFGTLKALGWRTRRIIAQVLGESLVMGIAGAAAGVGLGFAGAAIIAAVAPTLSATAPSSTIGSMQQAIQAGGTALGNNAVLVPLHTSISIGVIGLAVILAIGGGLLAGAFGSWRAARLAPAAALRRVE
jgi:putative ABC transport system permease protein